MDSNAQYTSSVTSKKFVVKEKSNGPINKKDLFLPSLTSNVKNDPTYNNVLYFLNFRMTILLQILNLSTMILTLSWKIIQ